MHILQTNFSKMELVVVKLSGLGASWIDIGMDALSTNDFVTVMCAHSHTSPFVPCPSDVDRSLEFTCSQDVVASKIDKIRIVALRPPLPANQPACLRSPSYGVCAARGQLAQGASG